MTMQNSNLTFRETISPDTCLERKVVRIIKELTEVQNSYILETETCGTSLYIDGYLQSSEKDAHIYHEALVHPAIFSHKNPKKVLIAGGGELRTLLEVLKHKEIDHVDMVDIDEGLVESCKQNLFVMHQNCFEDKRAQIHYKDIRDFVDSFNEKEKYDIMIYDLVDPLEGEEVGKLYTKEMFEKIKSNVLKEDGIFVTQATSFHILNGMTAIRLKKTLENVFGFATLYSVFMPSFLENWGFVIANLKESSERDYKRGEGVDEKIKIKGMENILKFYDEESHVGMFGLGKDLRAMIEDESIEIITMENLPEFY